MNNRKTILTYLGLGLFGILGPILFPAYTLSIAYLWMMVLMASTWDLLGGQMGYNSLGNIAFLVLVCMYQPLFRCRYSILEESQNTLLQWGQ